MTTSSVPAAGVVFVILCFLLYVLMPYKPEPVAPVWDGGRAPIVAVTGASGYLAGHIVQQLGQKGYAVRGSVRSLKNEQKVSHLRNLFPKMELFEADLMAEGSFDAMFDGVTYVIHTASPFIPTVPDPQRDLVDPALKGTLNVMKSALKYSKIKRVVVTSSTAAVSTDSPPEDRMKMWSEADWNMESSLTKSPYRYSKRLAEEAAYEFVKNNKNVRSLELATINPSFMLGPPLSNRTDATSIKTVKAFLEGMLFKEGAKPLCFGAVDVRDVARAHVAGMELPEADGKRFIMSSTEAYPQLELAKMLAKAFPDWPLPTTQTAVPDYCPRMNTKQARDILGINFTPIPKTINEMAQTMVRMGIAKKPDWFKPPFGTTLRVAMKRASERAFKGGFAGALAMIIQVLTLMWLRTTMNYQYKYGHTTTEALSILYKEGGIARFYQGLLPALIQGPMSRFFDTASNAGVLGLLETQPGIPVWVKTILASATAAGSRVLLMPVDACKTIMQVEGKEGIRILMRKVKDGGVGVLFHGALASISAGFVGHYPWFTTYNVLNEVLPVAITIHQKIIRNAFMGMCATTVSDTCSNSLRVVKTVKQSSDKPTGYAEIVRDIIAKDGIKGFLFRGLGTRLLVNILQGMLFSVMWKLIQDAMA